MRGHGVERHRSPRVILGGWLWEPDIASVTGEVAILKRFGNGVAITDFAASGVDDVGTAFHVRKHVGVEQVLRFGVQRAVDGHHVTDRDHFFHGVAAVAVVDEVQFLFDFLGQTVTVAVVQLAVERMHPAQDGKADTPSSNGPDVHALYIHSNTKDEGMRNGTKEK